MRSGLAGGPRKPAQTHHERASQHLNRCCSAMCFPWLELVTVHHQSNNLCRDAIMGSPCRCRATKKLIHWISAACMHCVLHTAYPFLSLTLVFCADVYAAPVSPTKLRSLVRTASNAAINVSAAAIGTPVSLMLSAAALTSAPASIVRSASSYVGEPRALLGAVLGWASWAPTPVSPLLVIFIQFLRVDRSAG